jgi:hypothetical protein
MFIVNITMGILTICIFIVIYGRMIEIYLMTSLAPIPFATFGNREQKVLGIYEVLGIKEARIELGTLFEFQEEGERGREVKGRLVRTAQPLTRLDKLRARNGQLQ